MTLIALESSDDVIPFIINYRFIIYIYIQYISSVGEYSSPGNARNVIILLFPSNVLLLGFQQCMSYFFK